MKYLLLLMVSFVSLIANAQDTFTKKIDLDWQQKQLIKSTKQGKFIYMPVVVDNPVDTQLLLPTYSTKWKIPSNTSIIDYKISNVIYETISKKELLDISVDNIPSAINLSLTDITTRGVFEAVLQLTPLVKQNGRINKIISFSVTYSLKQKLLTKNSQLLANNSVLSQGEWFKFSIDTTGVYKLSRSFLKDLGLNISDINPKNIAIYGNGGQLLPYRIGDERYDDLQENAIFVSGEDDGNFDSNDFILFYAKGPDDWKHNNTIESVRHRKNIYTDKAYYFVHVKTEPAKRIDNSPIITQTPSVTYTNYDDYIVHEIERKNLSHAGQQWMGESFEIQNEREITMEFKDLDTNFPISVRTRVVGVSSISTSMFVSVNNQDLYTINIGTISEHTLAIESEQTVSIDVTSDMLHFNLSFNNNGNAAAECYLDFIEVKGKKNLIANNQQFSFRNFDVENQSGAVAYTIQNTSNILQVWDVTDYINPKQIQDDADGSDFTFVANADDGLHEYIVLNENDYYTPAKVGRIENQNLHALNDVDYVIITKESFINEAERLANFHRNTNGLNVKVVPLYQIYNEFGSGAPDITAIRDFVKLLYEKSSPHLQYVLLFGDASFDFKGIQYEKPIVPSFESYESYNMSYSFVTDDFFVTVDGDNEGDLENFSASSQDIAVGRIPISNSTDANGVITKILNYYNEVSLGDWRNQILLAADDIDQESDETLQISQEALSDNIKQNKPLLNIKKVWTDAYHQVISSGGSRYPEVNEAITDGIERGVLLFDYFGHGGEDGLALERLLETEEIRAWNNFDAQTLLIVISCEFSRFDNPYRPNTAGELSIRNTHGGAAHHIGTARQITIDVGRFINDRLIPLLLEYNNEDNSISENLRIVKNQTTSKLRFFVFSFGDPAMHLALPKPDIKLTHMNGIPVTQSLDTISALSHVSFEGIVTDQDGTIDTNFNGELSVIVYDKPVDKATLTNDGYGEIMTFDTQESKIFRGSASVTSGQFSFDFVAPRDIRIAYGHGKLSFYADNQIIDKGGYNTDIVVGGINEDAPEDNLGPRLRLYMNNESFIDGGTTNQSPLFLAFFEDENGINTSLTSVDHDIVAILDGNEADQIILNDYYTTALNDYTKGSLEYRLRDLEVGPHIISLKAYDTYNNPAEATLHFIVLDDGEMRLNHVLNYPNPFVNYTEFRFESNKFNEPLEVQIQIFTISGKLVKTINKTILGTGGVTNEISWNGLDDFGEKIGKGVYVYKLEVKATLSNLTAKKYEKLVILQ